MRRLLLVASIVFPAAGCGSEQPPSPATRWSAAQAVGPAFEVAPYYSTIHAPGRQIFTAPRVTWTGGTAVAVWSDLWRRMWAAQLGSTGVWTPPVSIASPNRVPPSPTACSPFPCTGEPALGGEAALVNVPGGAQAFWQQTWYTDGPGIWSAASPPGGAWSAPHGQQALPRGSVQGPVAKSAASQAIVAWQLTYVDSTIWAQRYGAGAPLAVATRLRSGDPFWLSTPAVDIDAAGTAVVVWNDLDGVHARWYSAAGGWGPDRVLPGADTFCPVVALDGAGGAIAAWRELTNPELVESDSVVSVARLTPDGGWEARESTTNPSFRSGCPQIASASSGDAVLVWANAGANRGLFARPMEGHAGPVRKIAGFDAAHEITSLRVAMDGGGNGYVAWIRARTDTSVTGTYSVRPPSGTVWASHFVNGGAEWEVPEALQGSSSSQSDVATMIDIAVDADGSALAFWFEFESSTSMFTPWAARAVGR